jgi:hypothetical protein
MLCDERHDRAQAILLLKAPTCAESLRLLACFCFCPCVHCHSNVISRQLQQTYTKPEAAAMHQQDCLFVLMVPLLVLAVSFHGWVQLQRSCVSDPCNTLLL